MTEGFVKQDIRERTWNPTWRRKTVKVKEKGRSSSFLPPTHPPTPTLGGFFLFIPLPLALWASSGDSLEASPPPSSFQFAWQSAWGDAGKPLNVHFTLSPEWKRRGVLSVCASCHPLSSALPASVFYFSGPFYSPRRLSRWLCLDWGAICSITPTARASIPFFCSHSRGYRVGNRFFVSRTNSSWHCDSPICHGRQKQKAFELEKHDPVIALYNQMEKKKSFLDKSVLESLL